MATLNYPLKHLCLTIDNFAEMDICTIVSATDLYALRALTLLAGRHEGHPACKKTEWWSAGMVISLE